MSRLQEHHAISIMLLVGRSLSTGMPWTMAEDRAYIAQERLLWASLSEEERQAEQDFMAALWGARGLERKISIDSAWGVWTEKIGPELMIPDSAFGLPKQDFRPLARGVPEDAPERFRKVFQWLWNVGFQPVDADAKGFSLVIPVNRLIQEAERLTALLVKINPRIPIKPFGSTDGVQIRSVYDPISGQAMLEVVGLNDSVFG